MADEAIELTGNIEPSKPPVTSELKERLLAFSQQGVTSDWIRTRRQNIRPWGTFLSYSRFQLPPSATAFTQRCIRNVEYFQSNYLFVFLGLVLYCLLTSPLLLIALAASLGACYVLRLKTGGGTLHVFGHNIPPAHQYGIIYVLSFPLFYLAGAGSAFFWVIGASFFIIILHAATFNIDGLAPSEDRFDLETV